MGTKVYGIGACQSPDNVGETIVVSGMNLDKCRILSDEHADDDGNLPMFRIVGAITKAVPITNEKECQDERQLKCWKEAAVPFIYVEGELADGTDHPDAQSAASLIKFCQQPNIPLKIGLSVEGGTIERGGADQKTLMRTLATGFALTVKPCNPKCSLYLMNDLAKSERNLPPPARYFEALKKSQSSSSIVENRDAMLRYYIERLKKSLTDYMGGFTHIKCHNCGNSLRFFKSTESMPNGCTKCGNSFSMSDIWKSLNR
jgi:ribosomal protein S27E